MAEASQLVRLSSGRGVRAAQCLNRRPLQQMRFAVTEWYQAGHRYSRETRRHATKEERKRVDLSEVRRVLYTQRGGENLARDSRERSTHLLSVESFLIKRQDDLFDEMAPTLTSDDGYAANRVCRWYPTVAAMRRVYGHCFVRPAATRSLKLVVGEFDEGKKKKRNQCGAGVRGARC
ncbi:hypothetical protein CBOM_07503 [Ceraceosorus bombacis]|uniref:Uncharacterized protein n=1 Tax=Ceraceosorus bombacis TaxID=401625 RepID=A0A0N7L9L5_9BASI|nr:hypothetical protein CBOM_07503 [Ceraceosorus bombacis]